MPTLKFFIWKCSWWNFQFHNIDAKCGVTSVLLRFLVKKLQNYWFQHFLVRMRFKNLPASVLVKPVLCSDIQEHLLYWLFSNIPFERNKGVGCGVQTVRYDRYQVKFKIKIGRYLPFSFHMVSLRVLKKEIFRGVFRTLSNAYDEVFLAEVVNVFQPFTIFASST